MGIISTSRFSSIFKNLSGEEETICRPWPLGVGSDGNEMYVE
jgi:hypothetical protein